MATNFPLPDIGLDVPQWLQNFLNDITNNFSTIGAFLDTTTQPPAVSGLHVTQNTLGNLIQWTASGGNTNGYRLWRNTTNSFGTATLIAQLTGPPNTSFFDSVDQTVAGQTRYYWVQSVTVSNVGGPISAAVAQANFGSDPSSTALGKNATASGVNSVACGASSVSAGSGDVSLGISATTGSGGSNNVVIGDAASSVSNSSGQVVIGASADASGNNNVAIGQGTTVAGMGVGVASSTAVGQGTTITASNSTAVGQGNTITHASVVLVGNGISSTAANQVVIGSSSTNYGDIFLGRGVTHTGASQSTTVHATDATGMNTDGDTFALIAGRPTGSGTGGAVEFWTAPPGASSSTLQTAIKRIRIDQKGNVVTNASGNAIATNTNDGFAYIPSMAGPPTGTPTTFTGATPIVYDTTGNNYWAYNEVSAKWVPVNVTPVNQQTFTANGTWTLPSGWTTALCLVIMTGGGGGGGGNLGAQSGSSGGGSSGEAINRWVPVSANQTVTIGAGGSGGSGADGSPGSDTTFGALLTAKGGPGGKGSASSAGASGGTFTSSQPVSSAFGAAANGGSGVTSNNPGNPGGTIFGSGASAGTGGTGTAGAGGGGGGGCGLFGSGGAGGSANNTDGSSASANTGAGGGGSSGRTAGGNGTGGNGGSGYAQVIAYQTS